MVSDGNVKRIICLANSRKPGRRCIAGKEILPAVDGGAQRIGGWIRPVSAGAYEAVSDSERRYQNGSDPQVLDVIDVPVPNPQPHDYQQENWLIDNRRY